MHISRRLLALGVTSAILFAACSSGTASEAPASRPRPRRPRPRRPRHPKPRSAPASEAPAVNTDWKACVAFDTGGLGDKGFNDLALKGLEDAKAAGYTTFETEAQNATDYAANIQRLLDQGCQTIVTVGFNQGGATAETAWRTPTSRSPGRSTGTGPVRV